MIHRFILQLIPGRRSRMTPRKAAAIKFLLKLGFNQHQAAAVVGVNQGRVSEIANGKRFLKVPPADKLPPPDEQLSLNV